MRDELFAVADQIARELARKGTDINELAKMSGYLSARKSRKDFFEMLDWMVGPGGRAVLRSGRTLGYYQDIRRACQRLKAIEDVNEMAEVLGWSVRLMRYYQTAPGPLVRKKRRR
ncbi:MAG TPA: hypothetical protein EYH31_07685 [Anaerolineae bacterium]|nr:hypothetical protein [Anaerolineae bacterium]